MSLIFIHLSDIHFGQEKGGQFYPNNDAKEQLLEDAREFIATLPGNKATGLIISGDIAYAGKPTEYEAAGRWLDRLTAAVGCDITAVQLVPGNHDIDRSNITNISQKIIDEIIEGGDVALDRYMESEQDREVLYRQFESYRAFAEGYDCPLDAEGLITGHRTFEIAVDRRIKFHGFNTALICSKSEKEEGGLLLGKRQRVIRSEPGQELVVIAHHPMRWLQDSVDAQRYIKNRARVFISGHEHQPAHSVEHIDDKADLLTIASGATVPPEANDLFTYCYNILKFDWNEESDSLIVTIYGRIWEDDKKLFSDDNRHFTGGLATYDLKCPNFKKLGVPCDNSSFENDVKVEPATPAVIIESGSPQTKEVQHVPEKTYQLTLLKFFRDLTSSQRLSILVELGALPAAWSGPITHSIERRTLDMLYERGKLEQINERINKFLSPKIGAQNHD